MFSALSVSGIDVYLARVMHTRQYCNDLSGRVLQGRGSKQRNVMGHRVEERKGRDASVGSTQYDRQEGGEKVFIYMKIFI